MYRRVMAFDYDGTLAESGKIPQNMLDALRQLRNAGYVLFLVTGRDYASIPLEALEDIFTGIVWENGAVLTRQPEPEIYLPFGQVDPHLVKMLEATGIPLEKGEAIVSSWSFHDQAIWQTLAEFSGDAAISHNKGAIMILPPGVNKGTGLERLLQMCEFSARNLVCFGDGENDMAMFSIAETTVAVADAVDGLKNMADVVTQKPGHEGVIEALRTYWLDGEHLGGKHLGSKQHCGKQLAHSLRDDKWAARPQIIAPKLDIQLRNGREIPLGINAEGETVSIFGDVLAGNRMGIFGDSGSGKSWLTGLLVEGMHRAGYQVLLFDPEGDHRNLSSLPGFIALTGNEGILANPAIVPTLLQETSISIVLDLSSYPVDERINYTSALLNMLHPLRKNKFRPHWIVMEEAQHFLPLVPGSVEEALRPMLLGSGFSGGWAFISYRPDRLASAIRDHLQHYLLARIQEEEVYQGIAHLNDIPPLQALAKTPVGSVWLCGQGMVRLKTGGRRVPHVRHLYKYLDRPLAKSKRFYFCLPSGYIGTSAASLFEFKEFLDSVPVESIEYHHRRGDFVRWVRSSLDDDALAGHLEKLARRTSLTGDALRHALSDRVHLRYAEMHEQL